MKATRISLGAVLLAMGSVLLACEDEEVFEITGPAVEEVVAAAQASPDGIRIDGVDRIDGGAEPWIFIDGVRQSKNLGVEVPKGLRGHGDLDPRLIEKITVIKGSKAIELYGPDAGAGVILITTKDTVPSRGGSR